jgi:hypothetical protein
MFVALMPLHILLCDGVLPYFILRIEVVRFEFGSKGFEFTKRVKAS